jgi:flavin reductase (DIM6/NTAB) family NADH-FMN oxidoreductase RutF
MKKSVPIKPFWYSDKIVWPKTVTIITTLNTEGVPNAAPVSGIIHYDNMGEQPRVLLCMRRHAHTMQNIIATGEFVVNFPSYDFTDDILEACRFYPKGVNELDFMKMDTVPSLSVKPPTLLQSRQAIECTLDRFYELDKTQGHAIGNIVNIMVDEELVDATRPELAKAIDPVITLGDAGKKFFHWTRIGDIQVDEVKPPPAEEEARFKFEAKLVWDEGAMQLLKKVPVEVRAMVGEMAEGIALEEGASSMTNDRFQKMVDDYTPPALVDTFDYDSTKKA